MWRASLDRAPQLPELAETLSEDERARAGRFAFDRDRRRFIACRGVLRAVLGRYLGAAPGSLEFRYGRHGKPAFRAGAADPPLRFNVSHADGLALYGVTLGREIGVDLERIRPEVAEDQIAERFFSPAEVAALRALTPASRGEAFFRCWTRKEAYVKARGTGLSLPLDRFHVSLGPGEPPALLSTLDEPTEASRWSLRELCPGLGYIASLAVEGHDWSLRCWQWPDA